MKTNINNKVSNAEKTINKIDPEKVKAIVDQIDGGILTHISLTNSNLYSIMRKNLEGVIQNLVDDGQITIN